MATFLFAWELGSGLGHVTVIQPLAAKLRERGHKVVVALRDLTFTPVPSRTSGAAHP